MIFYTKRKLFEMKKKQEITRKLYDFFGVSAKIGYTKDDEGVTYFLKIKRIDIDLMMMQKSYL